MNLRHRLNPHGYRVVLVLQGGGALGAYQAGVYQAMDEHGLAPEWIVGTSIGAINGALIAGNEPGRRLAQLKAFWDRIAHADAVDMRWLSDAQRRSAICWSSADTVLWGARDFFRPRPFNPFALNLPVAPEQASFYDSAPLSATLHELVDFEYLNAPGGMRLTVTAVNVQSGELAHFDSLNGQLAADHIRASGSLPPGFAPVRIDGQLYWDGGLYSNTPLESVLGEASERDTLCFLVDLWSATGEEPGTLEEVRTRMKDVMFASRSKRHIDDYAAANALRHKLRELYARLPEAQRTPEDAAELAALGCDATMHVVRIPYSGHDWHMASKDINFSRGSIEWRWDQGYRDGLRALRHAGWLTMVPEETAVVVHDLPPEATEAKEAAQVTERPGEADRRLA
ncbi:MAG: patatin-like phospholipase family protein [Gammaproteobacteria bacterium]